MPSDNFFRDYGVRRQVDPDVKKAMADALLNMRISFEPMWEEAARKTRQHEQGARREQADYQRKTNGRCRLCFNMLKFCTCASGPSRSTNHDVDAALAAHKVTGSIKGAIDVTATEAARSASDGATLVPFHDHRQGRTQ